MNRSLWILGILSVMGSMDLARADFVKNQYVVRLRPDLAEKSSKEIASIKGVKILDRISESILLVEGSSLAELRRHSQTALVEPNWIYRTFGGPSDPEFGKAWALANVGQLDNNFQKGLAGVDVNAVPAWSMHTGSKDMIVAVIDSGVDYEHPDLKENIWTNEIEARGRPGVDDDGNGYVDDIHGYNFPGNNGNPLDDQGHGTHCSGTIGARGGNGVGSAGLNWNVRIMALKYLDRKGEGTLADAVRAVDYARNNGARIISASWGGTWKSEILEQAIAEAGRAGVLFVAAAGNSGVGNDDGYGAYPASYDLPNILAVGAVDNRGNLAPFSNYGVKRVHIAAPGVQIYSTWRGGSYGYFSGTSMAAPFVSGGAALLWSREPQLTYAEVKARLMATSRPLHSLKNKISSGGMLDLFGALSNHARATDPDDASQWPVRRPVTVSSEHPYKPGSNMQYRIEVPGAQRMAVHFAKFETEERRDRVFIVDRDGNRFGPFSGVMSDSYAPIVEGDSLTVELKSDMTEQAHGFDIDFVAIEK